MSLKGNDSGGKRKGLEAVSDTRGIVAALAIDQRGALRSLFARSMGITPESVPAEPLIQFKEAVSRILTPHASAILLDPEYGLPAARQRSTSAGLLLAYEKTGYDKKVAGTLAESARSMVSAKIDGSWRGLCEDTLVLLEHQFARNKRDKVRSRGTCGRGVRRS